MGDGVISEPQSSCSLEVAVAAAAAKGEARKQRGASPPRLPAEEQRLLPGDGATKQGFLDSQFGGVGQQAAVERTQDQAGFLGVPGHGFVLLVHENGPRRKHAARPKSFHSSLQQKNT